MSRILWPVYVYSYLELVTEMLQVDAQKFLEKFEWRFKDHHKDELAQLRTVTLKAHVFENPIAKLYREKKYRIPLNAHIHYNLIGFLEMNSEKGGKTIVQILQTYCTIIETSRGPVDQYSFQAIVNRSRGLGAGEVSDIKEGIEGGFEGLSNHDLTNNDAEIKLGPMVSDPDLIEDVRAELAIQDARHPKPVGTQSYTEIYNAKIKEEDRADAISRMEIPLPPAKARNVEEEVLKVKEHRDALKIGSRTGGVGPGVSCCMYTFHNTFDT